MIPANSKKAEKYAEKVIKVLNSSDRKYIKLFEDCHKIIDSLDTPTDDQIKRSKYTSQLVVKAKEMIGK
jgi:hypothetical protein